MCCFEDRWIFGVSRDIRRELMATLCFLCALCVSAAHLRSIRGRMKKARSVIPAEPILRGNAYKLSNTPN